MAKMWAYVGLTNWMLVLGMAQELIPANWTASEAAATDNMTVSMQISVGGKMVPIAPVLALSAQAATGIPPTGLSGPLLFTNPSNALNVDTQDISFISCDTYTGNIQANQVFEQAIQVNAAAVVLFSHYSDYCQLEGYELTADGSDEYLWVYTMKNMTDTERLLNETSDSGQNGMYASITTLAQRSTNTTSPPGGSSGSGANGGGNPPPGTPSTAVAMVILYVITGVITALFLVIIITGAIRARRHPERYGPRNIVGRPRQSRARGLALAMLETLPIVKFGEREQPKPADVELAEHSPERNQSSPTAAAEQPPTAESKAEDSAEGRKSVEGGIAAAEQTKDETNPDHLGCSICTEDFQAGEDQRVLPCDHRFHPACIDPWLLNVSGTCPLCRIDLRPQGEETGEVDENGNPVLREPGMDLELTVPATPTQRMGVRRSIIAGIRGIGRPQQMSREERIAALQQMRNEHLARMERQAATQNAEEERSTRQRLRRAFGVRTRRTETTEQTDVEASSSAAPTSGRSGEADV